MAKRERRPPLLLGWREWVSLPDLGVSRIKTKVDTGARTSSLHAIRIRPFELDGRRMVRFVVHPQQRSTAREITCEAPVLAERLVRSSSGKAERRYVIATTLEVAGTRHRIELTLAGRDAMGFRMLLGREALRGTYVVDSGRSFLGERAIAVATEGPRRPVAPQRKRFAKKRSTA
ncbi:MAG: RimK/LysX family protein [Chloroflexi bacterium]|nr:RimK/LysX family protein [Chloroflexota bacterium]MDA1002742.1 RimK/LysX family protein [Chloroflexota bacterium]